MPIYEFSCTGCDRFEQNHPMGSVPDLVDCPVCGTPARRMMSAPHLSAAGSSAYGLIETAARSAAEPDVVDSIAPGRRAGSGRTVTTNPLHRMLPRP